MIFNNRVYMYNQIRQKCPFRCGPDKEYCSVLELTIHYWSPLKARECVKNDHEKCPMFTYMELFLEQAKPQMKDW